MTRNRTKRRWIGGWWCVVAMTQASPRMLAQQVVSCAATPEAAARRETGASAGYRVVGERGDATGGRVWSLIETCGRPEVPWIAVRSERAIARRSALLMHAGEPVGVAMRGVNSVVILEGVVLENARESDRVHVRVHAAGAESEGSFRVFAGVVSADGKVEVKW